MNIFRTQFNIMKKNLLLLNQIVVNTFNVSNPMTQILTTSYSKNYLEDVLIEILS